MRLAAILFSIFLYFSVEFHCRPVRDRFRFLDTKLDDDGVAVQGAERRLVLAGISGAVAGCPVFRRRSRPQNAVDDWRRST